MRTVVLTPDHPMSKSSEISRWTPTQSHPEHQTLWCILHLHHRTIRWVIMSHSSQLHPLCVNSSSVSIRCTSLHHWTIRCLELRSIYLHCSLFGVLSGVALLHHRTFWRVDLRSSTAATFTGGNTLVCIFLWSLDYPMGCFILPSGQKHSGVAMLWSPEYRVRLSLHSLAQHPSLE